MTKNFYAVKGRIYDIRRTFIPEFRNKLYIIKLYMKGRKLV